MAIKYGLCEECLKCKLNKYIYNVKLPKNVIDIYQKRQLMKIEEADENLNSQEFVSLLEEEYLKYFPHKDFTEIKPFFNQMILDKYAYLEKLVNEANDPLLAAIQLAIVGNFIDFGAFENVDENKLLELLNDFENKEISFRTLSFLKNDLNTKKTLLYITDNCGEIVLDKLLMSIIKKHYPHLKITALLRGEHVINDASLTDAKEIKLDEVAEYLDNGTTLAGTFLDKLDQKRLDLIKTSDVIISKGQGNAESLLGCNLNIYYILICKCEHFARIFNSKILEGVLHSELKDEINN